MSSSSSRSRRARAGRRRVWLAVGATVIGGAGLATAAVVLTPDHSPGTDNAEPRPASADTIALIGSDSSKRALPRTDTKAFSLIGVSWKDRVRTFDGTAQIRTRAAADGEWTDWRDLGFDTVGPETDEGRAPGTRGASEPLWVGPSDAVEARVTADGKQTTVPDGLRLDLIDPGTTPQGKGNANGQNKGNGQGQGNGQNKGNGQGQGNTGNGNGGTKPGDSAGETAAPTQQPSSPDPSSAPGDTPPDAASSATPTSGAGDGSSDTAPSPTAEAPTDEGGKTPEPTGPADPTTGAPAPTSDTGSDTPPTAGPEPAGPADSGDSPAPGDSTRPEPAESAAPPTGEASQPPAPPAPETTAPTAPTGPATPAIVDRATWGADESLVEDPPEYLDKVKAVFVHHTAGTNDYSCADSPAVMRAILVYHVRTEGWNDLGYNFFVDKCGTVFEGRAGGVGERVRGAHTYGFNGDSAGISLLGDYENGGTPTAAAKQAIADLAAWKLGLDGVDPQAEVTLTAAGDTGVYKAGQKAVLNTVSGHRDGYATLCPGKTLYSALPGIRTAAGQSRYAAR
ncbi:N-acetylmuramoyl-L-alanine amidase [Streptomyces sp. CoT10]|uniref:N-acetylmuramoyl-L-alanine amidase n=1 Tax=Streptomyces sp. CoT10 TaxID=2875762 RepID=UPI001CD4AB12|nr:peptidoglycan recognition protein [Streptomyces sp. CoT10]